MGNRVQGGDKMLSTVDKNEEIKKESKLKKKFRFRLSLKIIIINFVATILVNVTLFILLLIIRASVVDVSLIINPERAERWLSILSFIIGIISMVLFAVAINLFVVKRIKKLNESTKEIAAGNFDIKLEEKGTDELSELARSFNKMSAELKANEYLAKEFVRNISHEYKTPLSVIKAYGEWIEGEAKEKKIDWDTLEEYAGIIMNETDRMATLSKSMLQLSLLDSTTIIKKEDEFSPSAQINNILRIMQVKWTDKNIEFDLDLDSDMIKSNEQLLYQVWQNLISNAIKFSLENGKIKIMLKITEQELIFEINNGGSVLSDEDKEKIFTQFYMADKSRNTEGSGLGLAITKRIVDKLGGEIMIESGEERGTTFVVNMAII